MATAESPSRLSTVVLFGKGLTPGKFRGLQRISNPNGTLTMVALDQNSSMIEMATKALKGKGQDREPTYEEIVEAKVDLRTAPGSGRIGRVDRRLLRSLVERRIGGDRAPDGLAGSSRDVGQPQKQSGSTPGLGRARLERREDQTHGGRCRQAAGSVRTDRAALGRAPVSVDRPYLHRVPEARHSLAAGNRGVPVRRREEDGSELSQPEGSDGHRVGPPAQPILRYLQGRIPRHDGP